MRLSEMSGMEWDQVGWVERNEISGMEWDWVEWVEFKEKCPFNYEEKMNMEDIDNAYGIINEYHNKLVLL